MNDDNIVLEPGSKDSNSSGLNDNPVEKTPEQDGQESEGNSSKIFDFSSDLNISVVKEDAPRPNMSVAGIPTNPFKPISITPLPRKTVAVPPVLPGEKEVPGTEKVAPKPSLAGDDTHAWPFASKETQAGMKPGETNRETKPSEIKPVGMRPGEAEMGGPAPAFSGINLMNKQPVVTRTAPVAQTQPAKPAASQTTQSTPPVQTAQSAQSNTPSTQNQSKPWSSMSLDKVPTPIFTPQPSQKPSAASLLQKPDLSKPTDDTFLKNLRTYEGDIAEAMSHRGGGSKMPTSMASVAIAESKKRGEGETLKNLPPIEAAQAKEDRKAMGMERVEDREPSHLGSKLVIVLICIILIGGGILTGYFLYSKSPLAEVATAPKPRTTKELLSLVPSDTQSVIITDSLTNIGLMAKIRAEFAKPQKKGAVAEIILTETKEGVSYRVSSSEAADIVKIDMPDIIKRTLKPQWMLGSYTDVDAGLTPFVMITTNLFQNAFAGMLSWEPHMADSLKTFIDPSMSASAPAPKGTFKDEIIRNKDVRAFVTEDGRTLFEYSFLDNETLVIAGNDSAMNAVINRLESKAFVR